MTLEESDNEESIGETMETEVANNHTPLQQQPFIDHSSSSKLVTPLPKPTTFVWEN